MQGKYVQSLVLVHLATFLISFVGPLVQVLDLHLVWIACVRALVAAVCLKILLKIFNISIKLHSKRDYALLILLGILQAAQWLTIFHAIRVAGVAIALIALFSFPVLVVLLESYFFKEPLRLMSVLAALLVLVGVGLTLPDLDVFSTAARGVFWGLLSALLVAVPLLLHRNYVRQYSSLTLAFYKMGVAALVLLPIALLIPVQLHLPDVAVLFLLGVLVTAVPYAMVIRSLRYLKAGQVGMITSLEVVYGIGLAWLMVDEVPSLRVLLGGALVFLTVMLQSWYALRFSTGPDPTASDA